MKFLELPFEIREHIYRLCKVSDLKKLSLCCSDLKYEITRLLFCHLRIPYSELNDISSLTGKLEYVGFVKSLVIKDDQRETASWNDNALKNYNDILKAGCNIKRLYLFHILDNRLLKDTFLAGSNLEHIEITCYHYFKGPCWNFISNCCLLKSISLICCKLSNSIIIDISQHKHIEELKIVDCHGFTQMGHLKSMTQLRTFTFMSGDRYNVDFICSLHNLKYLDLSNTLTNNRDLEYISTTTQLETLKLFSCMCITAERIASIARHKSLTCLDLSYCNVRDECLGSFRQLEALSCLSLKGCISISDAGIKNIQILNLNTLRIDECQQLTDESLKYIQVLPLEMLTLNDCPLITNNGMQHISSMPTLKKLELMKCSGISDEGLEYLSLLRLTELKLTLTLFSGSAIKKLCQVSCLKNHRFCGSYQHWVYINSF